MPERERFIPFRAGELIARVVRDARVPAAERAPLAAVAELVRALIHHDFHARLERLKALYAPTDPDSDTRAIDPPGPADQQRMNAELVVELASLLERANYRRIGQDELNQALREESLFQVSLHTELDDFAELALFCRGSAASDVPRRGLLGRRLAPLRVEHYQRVAIYTRFKDAAYFAGRGRSVPFKPGTGILKLFQNIPKADLEMLFPNTDVRMRLKDRLLLGVPAVAGGVALLVKLGASLVLVGLLVAYWVGLRHEEVPIKAPQLVALGLGLATLAGYLLRQVNAFKNRRARFLKALSDSLYYRNLDNNAGVFNRLVDEAEEEEAKEAVLAYAFLLAAGRPLTAAELDGEIERWLQDALGADCDFEIDDGLAKLERWALIERDGDRVRAVTTAEARRRLDARWDGLYTAP